MKDSQAPSEVHQNGQRFQGQLTAAGAPVVIGLCLPVASFFGYAHSPPGAGCHGQPLFCPSTLSGPTMKSAASARTPDLALSLKGFPPMCGPFTLQISGRAVADFFGLPEIPTLPARYSIAPTQPVPAFGSARITWAGNLPCSTGRALIW
jgi:hypothetical protein